MQSGVAQHDGTWLSILESSIRQVINLRLKSNAMFWREPNAESMLKLRALVVSESWDDRLREKRR